MRRLNYLFHAPIVAATLIPLSTLAFEPHADCSFAEKPLPLVRDCGAEGDDILYWKNRVAGVNRALEALADPMSQHNQDRAMEAMEAGRSMAEAMDSLPNNSPGVA